MSLRRNSLANFAGQLYATLIGIVALPFYIEFLGAEAFGLVGFFVLLQSWLLLLTSGVAPTLARQIAVSRGRGDLGARPFREALRSLELVVLALALGTAALVWLVSDRIAADWLEVKTLSLPDVAFCIALMGGIAGLRWGVALYASGLGGMERQVWLNVFNSAFATLRFGGAYVLLRWVSSDVTHYFEYQLLVSLLELAVIAGRFYASQPPQGRQNDPGLAFSWAAIRPLLPFALGVTYTSMLWVLVTQTDKLILSHLLPLVEYGFFSVVVLIAGGVLRFADPVNQAVLPRLTMVHAAGETTAMLALYRKTTQYLVVIVASVAGVMALFPYAVLYALTGNRGSAEWGAPVLSWFALGNGLLVVGGMQYTLQLVHGQLRTHLLNTTLSTAVQVPILALVAYHYGAVEVALAWFCIRLITFFIWPTLVHRKYAPGLHRLWLRVDVLQPLLAVGLVLAASWALLTAAPQWLLHRWLIFPSLMLVGLAALIAGGLAAGMVRADAIRFGQQLRRAAAPRSTQG